ncbi:MAG: hypothetical protein RLY35_1022 [Bacteroidota bacterium]|jgi:uncharacterized protein (TIGR02145 family)
MKNLSVIFFVLLPFIWGCKKNENKKVDIEYGTVIDNDGREMKTVKIGDQWWMAENLQSHHFQNGDSLTVLSKEDALAQWNTQTSGACTAHNDSLYGYLYNFIAIEDNRNIAPKGWRIPSDEDWKILEKQIGMSEEAANSFGWRGTKQANQLVSQFSKGWPEFSALYGEDTYGFNALPGGCITLLNVINSGANTAFWWTSTLDNGEGYYRYIDYQQTRILRSKTSSLYGMSIRCIKE